MESVYRMVKADVYSQAYPLKISKSRQIFVTVKLKVKCSEVLVAECTHVTFRIRRYCGLPVGLVWRRARWPKWAGAAVSPPLGCRRRRRPGSATRRTRATRWRAKTPRPRGRPRASLPARPASPRPPGASRPSPAHCGCGSTVFGVG